MENENKDWKPEVGKTAWLKRYPYTIEQVMIIADCSTKLHYRQNYSIGEGEVAEYYSAQDRDYFFESPEAALASIKIYDLEGKEVVISRAEPVFSLDEMVEFFNKWIKIEGNMKLFLEAQSKQRPNPISIGKYIDRARDIVNSDVEARAMQMMLSDEAGMMNYTWEQCLEMARNEGGGAAIGGKSDQKESK
jgi:hypothetical protein